ncbi:uncharacterized protein LOC119440182 [Dermacentor silvarum]|uniref:uncharacterized protein LOC119440182 n=1 Tax=Dermacentor silvarum TaxID=543639 RepID=UPI001899DF96|nr:uncharacterized protein LOC119440182 [Dermacentor silvarum]
MVRDRLSSYLEERNTLADSMYGFRPNKSAQDILLQLHHEVLTPIEHPHNDKIILALDLKGAFDNVKHEVILAHLSATNCGDRTFNYIRNFLTDRAAYIRIQDQEYGPYPLGTRGTPQGAVLSPLLFNLAMVQLPARLDAVDGVKHALYADDITLWATDGNLGNMEDSLQAAAHIVDEYAAYCGLQSSPQKSEFVHIRPTPKCTSSINLSIHSGPINEAQEIRVLGLHINKHRRVETTLQKLRKVGEQVGRMVRRVSNKRGGLKSKDALRLAQAFVTSRILYATPYLYLRKHDEDFLEVTLRKIIKRALDLPISTSNARLLALGVVNTYRELREAHLTNQYTRLAQTPPGRRLLDGLHIRHEFHTQERVRVPEHWKYAIYVRPLPTNMSHESHTGRREARALALRRHYGSKQSVFYTDIAGPYHGDWYTAAVVHQDRQVDGLSFRAPNATHAEEVAIALAISHDTSKTIISDSRGAYRNFQPGWISPLAAQILRPCPRVGDPSPHSLILTPGHQELTGNEAAHAAASALIPRATASSTDDHSDPEYNPPLLTFKDISTHYRDSHRRFPALCKGLKKADERILLRLFTNTLLCPAVLKHFDSSFSGLCQYCGEVADTYHMAMVQRVTTAATTNGVPE